MALRKRSQLAERRRFQNNISQTRAKRSVKVIFKIHIRIQQVLLYVADGHLIQYQVLDCLLEVRLADEDRSVHSRVLRQHFDVLVALGDSEVHFEGLLEFRAAEVAEEDHLKERFKFCGIISEYPLNSPLFQYFIKLILLIFTK